MKTLGTGPDGPPSMTPDIQRVLVVGSGGAGKSTLARELARQAGLPVVHLDRYFWRPGWVATPVQEWCAIVAGLVAKPAWVMDGNYSGTLDLRIPAAELIVFLDLPRRVTISRALRRWARWRGRTRPDMAPECPERVDMAFLRWLWNYPRDSRIRLLRALDRHGAAARVVRLRTSREVRLWLGAAASPGLPAMRPLSAGQFGT
ncbi:adenylate kinase [Frankia sp. AgB32]|uniref:adenylate kinase n=1 Tax=Frankia sp. AgB32 TaxID=631119 RepID=UPI00200FF36D|nr:adenylate kinase [Frankia sp. AgB32]